MMKNLNVVSAKDMLISLANKLPETLLLDAVNDHGLFCMEFLLQLTEEQLCDLRKEARKHEKENIFLFFYSVPEEKAKTEVPCELKNYTNFDFSKVVSIELNGSTAPYLKYVGAPPIHYISVTFTLKN